MTAPHKIQPEDDPSQSERSRLQFIQELKVARLEKVKLHRAARERNSAAPRPAPAHSSGQHRLAPGTPRPHSSGPHRLAPGTPRPPGAAVARPPGATPRRGPGNNTGAGLAAEQQASSLPWMGRRAPLNKGGEIGPGKVIPRSTIQTDLARAPAAIGHARVLAPAEDPLQPPQRVPTEDPPRPPPHPPEDLVLQVERVRPQNTRAFVRLAVEKCRAIILALPDSGNLCRADIMSLATFKKLNQCAVNKMKLDPVTSAPDIRSVTGSSLKIEGKIRGGVTVLLQGSAGTLHLNPLVSSNFTGPHLNLSQDTMARLKIQLRPNSTDGGFLVTQMGKAPLVAKGGVYSLNYEDSLFKRISIFRHKNGYLQQRMKPTDNKRTSEVGQIVVSERRGLRALGMENALLKQPGDSPMILTRDGFLQVHQECRGVPS